MALLVGQLISALSFRAVTVSIKGTWWVMARPWRSFGSTGITSISFRQQAGACLPSWVSV